MRCGLFLPPHTSVSWPPTCVLLTAKKAQGYLATHTINSFRLFYLITDTVLQLADFYILLTEAHPSKTKSLLYSYSQHKVTGPININKISVLFSLSTVQLMALLATTNQQKSSLLFPSNLTHFTPN